LTEGKSILIISPQAWNTRMVSKQHYANELAKKSVVYFLNPPKFSILKSETTFIKIANNLTVISITLPIPMFIRFKLEPLFRLFYRSSLNSLLKNIKKIDILWNFDNGVFFKEERLFRSAFKIFHPVDDFTINPTFNYTEYDIGFAVSPEILAKIPLEDKFFINHGLRIVNESKLDNEDQELVKKDRLRVVYLGNLSIKFLDIKSLETVIRKNPNIDFDFIGDYDFKTSFISFLEEQTNVRLLGVMLGDEMEQNLKKCDILLVSYKKMDGYFADNSHKILEYLCTGNVIVSSHLTVYSDLDLFPMAKKTDNSDFVDVFTEVVSNFSHYCSKESRNKRIDFAMNNTYQHQVERINDLLSLK
jgi:hypothetical protein